MAAPIHDPLRDLDRELRQRRRPVEVVALQHESSPTSTATSTVPTSAAVADQKHEATQLLASIDARLARIEHHMPKGGIGMGVFRGLLLWQALHLVILATIMTLLTITGYTVGKLMSNASNAPSPSRTLSPSR